MSEIMLFCASAGICMLALKRQRPVSMSTATNFFRCSKCQTGLCLYRSSMGPGQTGAASAGMAERNSHRPNGTVNGNSSQYVI